MVNIMLSNIPFVVNKMPFICLQKCFPNYVPKCLHLAETWTLRAVEIRNTWKVLKCGAGEECRSVGPIM
jgi:hypothetical protein